MQMYYYCDVIACLIQGCRIIHTVTWLFLGYGFLIIVIRLKKWNHETRLTFDISSQYESNGYLCTKFGQMISPKMYLS